MKVNINFKFFSQSVSVGFCLILLGMTIAGVYAAVIRPDARWIIILVVFFTDLFSVFGIGRICRSYDIRTDGVVAIWFGIFRRFSAIERRALDRSRAAGYHDGIAYHFNYGGGNGCAQRIPQAPIFFSANGAGTLSENIGQHGHGDEGR